VWVALPEDAWQEAFDSHPRIGQQKAKAATETSLGWSSTEQSAAMSADEAAKVALAEGNKEYEEKLAHLHHLCQREIAGEILATLQSRVKNDASTELREAAEQQREITQLRLRRWLGEK